MRTDLSKHTDSIKKDLKKTTRGSVWRIKTDYYSNHPKLLKGGPEAEPLKLDFPKKDNATLTNKGKTLKSEPLN